MRVALAGASGIIGRFVIERLAREGCDIVALARPNSDRAGFDHPFEWIEGDLADDRALAKLVDGADALVHCAFDHEPGRYRGGEGRDVEAFWRINLVGSVGLLRAAADANVSRTVQLSSRAVFGQPVDGPITDLQPTAPTTHYGALKVALEALAGVYGGVTNLRPTGVYGLTYPASRSKWFDIASDVLAGRAVTTTRTATEVHGNDVAGAVWILLTPPIDTVAGRTFNCSDLVVSARSVAARMYQAIDRSGPLPPEDPPPVNVMQCDGLNAMGWRPGGEPLLAKTIDAILAAAR